jgi:hypothetical protein
VGHAGAFSISEGRGPQGELFQTVSRSPKSPEKRGPGTEKKVNQRHLHENNWLESQEAEREDNLI